MKLPFERLLIIEKEPDPEIGGVKVSADPREPFRVVAGTQAFAVPGKEPLGWKVVRELTAPEVDDLATSLKALAPGQGQGVFFFI